MSARDALAPLRIRPFRLLIGSMLLTTLGVQIQMAAVAYQVYKLTGDPLSLGLIGLAEALPFISLALFGGHVADSHDRRRVMMGALGIFWICSVALLALSHFRDQIAVETLKPAIYAVIAGTGVARSFFQPARNALAADLVPRELYPAAVTVRTGLFQASTIAGPALGGLLYAWLGPTGTYGAAAVCVLLGLVAMAPIPSVPPPDAEGAALTLGQSLREGFVFLRHERVLLPALMLDLFAVLFGGAVALLPVFANDILHAGAREYGLLRAAPGAGAVLVSVYLTLRRPIERAGITMLASVGIFGACIIGFALSRVLWLSLLCLALSGAADMVSVIVRGTLLQLRVPRAMLGRVSSINQIFIGSSNEIGAFESGVAAKLLGTVNSVLFGGSVTMLVVAITTWRAQELRRLGKLS